MTDGDELLLLKQAWQEGTPPPAADLYRTVVRHTWWIRAEFAGSVAVAVTFMGGTAWKAIVTQSPEYLVLAIWVWIVVFAAFYFSLRNWKGLRNAAGLAASDYLAFSIRRCQAALAATHAGLWLLLFQSLFLSGWHTWYWSHHQPAPALASWLLAACLPLAFLFALLILRSRHRHELQRLEALRRELTY